MSAMTLADFTAPGLIVSHLAGRDAPSVLHELSQALRREGRIPEVAPLYDTALKRERLVSTHVGAGIALPHARMTGLKELSFALGRTEEPLLWGSGQNGAVTLVFLLAVPANDSQQHLQLISGLSRFARDASLIDQLRSAVDAADIYQILTQVPIATKPKTTVPSIAPTPEPQTL